MCWARVSSEIKISEAFGSIFENKDRFILFQSSFCVAFRLILKLMVLVSAFLEEWLDVVSSRLLLRVFEILDILAAISFSFFRFYALPKIC
jgi:hypothetical protein